MGGKGEDACENVSLESSDGVCSEGHLCRENEEEQHTQRPHVYTGTGVPRVLEGGGELLFHKVLTHCAARQGVLLCSIPHHKRYCILY